MALTKQELVRQFNEKLENELRKIYKFFVQQERELYLKINLRLHVRKRYENFSMLQLNKELDELQDLSNFAMSVSSFIYINITGNCPIKNTLLICNEETNIEKIKAFFYRAIFCDKPILFVIANLECLELSVTQNIIKILYSLYKMKNRNINSYLLIIYRKVESGLGRDIEKLIPEKNILFDSFLKEPKKKVNIFNDTELYSSKYAGYGKTTEIMYKVEEKKGKYYYLPIGGSFIRNYVINNIENLHLDLENNILDKLVKKYIYMLIYLKQRMIIL